jgi:transcriptional regulator with XRE-family HTH domain
VNDLLKVLGKRVHELRAAKEWSQEQFAHVSGLHRTYIGQIERDEKNISIENLSKIAGVLGVTLSELLSGLEAGDPLVNKLRRTPGAVVDGIHRTVDLQKLVRRLRLQIAAMDKTILELEAPSLRRVERTLRTSPPAKRQK